MPTDASADRADWNRRLAPADASTDDVHILDVEAASERISRHPALGRWLRDAAFDAVEGLRDGAAAAQAQAHGRMERDLKEQFPALAEAVRAATGGCGRPALQWRPLQPRYSRVYLTFEGDHEPDVFCALRQPALSAVRHALQAVAEALPKGAPFAGRPNTATGLFEYDGRCLGVRYREHASEDGGSGAASLRRGVVLLPREGDPTDEHPEGEAARGVVAYFAPQERERWYER